MNEQQKHAYMTQTPIPKLVVVLGIPAMISMLVTSLYNMADTYFVSQIGDKVTAASAVSVVFSFMAIVQAIGFFFGHGSGNYISRALGNKDLDGANKMASVGFFSALIIGTLLLVFGMIFLEPFAWLLQANSENINEVKDYLFYILMGTPFMIPSFVLNNQLRYQGSAYYGMIGIIVGALVNIGLDFVLIFVCNMGVGGAGLATSISQFISFIILLLMGNRGGNIRIRLKDFKFTFERFKHIFIGGTPSLIRQGLSSVSVMCLNSVAFIVGGNLLVTSMGVTQKIMHFIFSVLLGLGQGFQPICGYNYGAKRYDRVLQSFYFALFASMGLVAVFSVICFIIAPNVVSLINSEPNVIVMAGTALRYQLVAFILSPFVVMSNMAHQNLGKLFGASLLAMLRQGLAYIPILYLMQAIGTTGIYLVQPLADLVSFIVSIPFTVILIKELKFKQKQIESQMQTNDVIENNDSITE